MEKITACNHDAEGDIFTTYNGKKIYFCEEECKEEFEDDPEKFINSDHFRITLEILEDNN